MTAKQKANQARFKKVVAEAKKLRKKNPKLTQAQAVKQAWAIMYSTKKVSGYSEERKKIHKNATSWIKRYQKRNDDDYATAVKKGYDQAAFGPAPKVGAVKKYEIQATSPDKKVMKFNTNTLKEAKDFVKVLKNEGFTDIKINGKKNSMGLVKKKAANKKASTKKSSSYHKDTKSHNVNIRVMSGIGKTKFYI